VVLVVLLCVIDRLVLAVTQTLVKQFPFRQRLFPISNLAKSCVNGLVENHFLNSTNSIYLAECPLTLDSGHKHLTKNSP